jgi:hypothetical protein
MIRSIKTRTTLLLIMVLMVIFLGAGIFLDRALNSIIFESIDEALHTRVEKINSLIEHGMDKLDMEFVEVQLGEYSVPYSGHYYQILLGDGSHFWSSPSLADESLPYMRDRLHGSVESFYEVVEGPADTPPVKTAVTKGVELCYPCR